MTSDNNSVHEANKLLRVLAGQSARLKFTVRVHRSDKTIVEWQSNNPVKVKWNDDARALWYVQGDYETRPIMPYRDGDMLLVEENPEGGK